jgi:histidyl-tRNA synthetase
MKAADRSGAAIAVIIGSDEVEHGTVVIRPMGDGLQFSCPKSDVLETIRLELQKLGS